MDWQEICCIIEALNALIEKYNTQLSVSELDEDDRSDISNDLAYTEILLNSYVEKRDNMANQN